VELTPDFLIVINGDKEFPKDRVISIRTTDEIGIVSDTCEIELDDFDDALQMPNTEAKVEVYLGYKETDLTKIGTYYVKDICIDGARRTVRIKANAISKSMRSQKTKSNENNLKYFLQTSCDDWNFDVAIDDEFSEFKLNDMPQFAESDMSYLTRISRKIGAVVKPSDGHLVVANNGSGKTVSGKNLPTKYIDILDIENYSCSFKETESGGGSGTIYANWYEKEAGEYHLVHAGSGDPEVELNEIFSSEKSAIVACEAKIKRVSQTNKSFKFSCVGRSDLFAECPLILKGFSKKIPERWIIARVEHSLSVNGFRTNVECY